MTMIPHFLDNWLTDDGEIVSLTCRLCFIIQTSGTHFCKRPSNPRAILRLEGLGQLKKEEKKKSSSGFEPVPFCFVV
jgi:hypothetical protein